jgi:low affinity Fe/Cu permease
MNTEAERPALGGATEPDAAEGDHSLDLFTRFSDAIAHATGTSRVFVGATAIVLLWLVSGPLFAFSNTWQLLVNTGTTVLTFLMVFVIQSTQNRDSAALHLKLDVIIDALSEASDSVVGAEHESDRDIEERRKRLEDRIAELDARPNGRQAARSGDARSGKDA